MRKDDLNVHVWCATGVAQNLIDYFFVILTVTRPLHEKDFKLKKYGGKS